jgi:hypothetical protein
MASYGFHPEASEEYLAATQYYLEHASELIAAAFVAEVETSIQTLRRAHAMRSNRGTTNSSLLAHSISLFDLLSLQT